MIDFLVAWSLAISAILVESGPYLLLGLALAGLIKVWIPEESVYRHLGGNDFRSVFKASLFGMPLPLCSCSVIPTATALRQSGASKGATTAFLISTPETGVDSIGVTYALMDPLMTLLRPIAALVTALGAGSAVNSLAKRGWDQKPTTRLPIQPVAACSGSCCGDHCTDNHDDDHDHEHHYGESRWLAGLRYGFGALLDDLTPWFVLGFLVSGLITVWLPADFFGETLPTGWTSMALMLVIGVPLYICATASTPVAAALIAKGLDPGSALVLLLAGPATNIATMLAVRGVLGRRVLWVYLVAIALFALAFGVLTNWAYGWLDLTPGSAMATESHTGYSVVEIVAGVTLSLLLLTSAVRIRLDRGVAAAIRRPFARLRVDPLGRTAWMIYGGLLLAVWLSSAGLGL